MGEGSKIEWTDHTFNPWWGCVKVSPACKNCYAETLAARFGTEWGPLAERRFFGDKHWAEPLKWNRSAGARGVRERVFCASMADVFEARLDLEGARERLYQLIEKTPHLDWLLLTKRPENVARIPGGLEILGRSNVWLGTTVEDQERAEQRIPILLELPARVRFLSCEPLLGPLDLWAFFKSALRDESLKALGQRWPSPGVDWVIVGGESGAGARPMHPTWALDVRDQCAKAGVPFFFKQWGEWASRGIVGGGRQRGDELGPEVYLEPSGEQRPTNWNRSDLGLITPEGLTLMRRVGKKTAGRKLDNVTWDQVPGATS